MTMNTVASPNESTIGNKIALLETKQDSPEAVSTAQLVVDQAKFEDLRKVVLDLSRASETVISQNAFLVQRLNELENNECSRLQSELENKTTQLKQAYVTLAEMKKREMEARSTNLTCIRCENGERQIVTLPCAHICVCKVCSKFTNNCFLCGRRQESTLEVCFRL